MLFSKTIKESDFVWYAIRHKKTGKLVGGTDFRYNNPHQRLSDDFLPPKLFSDINIDNELKHRRINTKYYDVVKVDLIIKGNRNE